MVKYLHKCFERDIVHIHIQYTFMFIVIRRKHRLDARKTRQKLEYFPKRIFSKSQYNLLNYLNNHEITNCEKQWDRYVSQW